MPRGIAQAPRVWGATGEPGQEAAQGEREMERGKTLERDRVDQEGETKEAVDGRTLVLINLGAPPKRSVSGNQLKIECWR